MKVKYNTKNTRLQVEIEGNSAKEIFKQLAEFQEVFDEDKCGLCGSQNLKFVCRTVDGNDFFEIKCLKCFGKLAFGQHKTGGSLFPKRKIDGEYKNQGWYKWEGN